jgi:hypothetical protein
LVIGIQKFVWCSVATVIRQELDGQELDGQELDGQELDGRERERVGNANG